MTEHCFGLCDFPYVVIEAGPHALQVHRRANLLFQWRMTSVLPFTLLLCFPNISMTCQTITYKVWPYPSYPAFPSCAFTLGLFNLQWKWHSLEYLGVTQNIRHAVGIQGKQWVGQCQTLATVSSPVATTFSISEFVSWCVWSLRNTTILFLMGQPFFFSIFLQQFLDLKKMMKYFSLYYLLKSFVFFKGHAGSQELGSTDI